jgi:hypothetical protein
MVSYGRRQYVLRGRDPVEDLNLLADAIAFEIITRYAVTKRLINRGTEDKPMPPGRPPRPSFGLPEPLVGIHTSRQSCCKAAKARIFTPVRESSGESRLRASGRAAEALVAAC